jgi:hypothetical protein
VNPNDRVTLRIVETTGERRTVDLVQTRRRALALIEVWLKSPQWSQYHIAIDPEESPAT